MTQPNPHPHPRLHRRVVDIGSLAEFDTFAAGSSSLAGWHLRHVDLTARTDQLLQIDPGGALFLGCRLEPRAVAHLDRGGALVYPEVPDTPVEEYRGALYTAAELFAGLADGYSATPDARIYAWAQGDGAAGAATTGAPTTDTGSSRSTGLVVRAMHDAAIEAALDAVIAADGRRVVGVMGGHAVARGDRGYREAARLGQLLGDRRFCTATGGGPGAMEAANLGAYLSAASADELDEAIDGLAEVPSFQPSVGDWAATALKVRESWPDGRASIGVPTWFYGHEPPNLFATGIAKFFQNSVREAVLLDRCDGGIVFLPGAAGTVQELFQDACENYYADPAGVAPMVLVGRDHWTDSLPAWPLLSALGTAGGFAHAIALVDDVGECADFIADYHASRFATGPIESAAAP